MRFSLRSFLLVLFVLALAASHLYTSWKLNDARREILALRTELGFLTIVDSDRLNLIQTPNEGWHSWRVYVPPGAHYTLRGTRRKYLPQVTHTRPNGNRQRRSSRRRVHAERTCRIPRRRRETRVLFLE